jgi:hypothetical protein
MILAGTTSRRLGGTGSPGAAGRAVTDQDEDAGAGHAPGHWVETRTAARAPLGKS